MSSFVTFLVICVVYYLANKYYPEYIETKYHYYFGGFVIVYLVFWYLYAFEYSFVHRTLRNIYDTSQQPLYSMNALQSNADLYYAQNPNHNIKVILAQNQGHRCRKCGNYMGQDFNEYPLIYTIPLQQGGQNSIQNLSLVCPTCYQFH